MTGFTRIYLVQLFTRAFKAKRRFYFICGLHSEHTKKLVCFIRNTFIHTRLQTTSTLFCVVFVFYSHASLVYGAKTTRSFVRFGDLKQLS